jgi:hypothetical protein
VSTAGKTKRARPLALVAAGGLVLAAAGPLLHGSNALAAIGDITEYTIPTASSQPYDIVAGPDGNLWFTEQLGNKVAKVTTSGIFAEYAVPTTNSQSNGIAAGPDGNLWFTEGSGRVAKVVAAGPSVSPAPTSGSQPLQPTLPRSGQRPSSHGGNPGIDLALLLLGGLMLAVAYGLRPTRLFGF